MTGRMIQSTDERTRAGARLECRQVGRFIWAEVKCDRYQEFEMGALQEFLF
jgi:hypothetical protein